MVSIFKKVSVALFALLVSTKVCSEQTNSMPKISCDNYSWSDVLAMVQPYLDETLYVALVIQGQSSNYNVSTAASQAMDESLPSEVKRTLQAIIKENC